MRAIEIRPIGRVSQGYRPGEQIPCQGREKVRRRSTIDIDPAYAPGLEGLKPGQSVWVLLWFDQAERDRLKVHPRGDRRRPLSGVFNTRSPHRPNPIALDLAEVVAVEGCRVTLRGLDAREGTPVLDLKPYSVRIDQP